jgi:hypothetical protein
MARRFLCFLFVSLLVVYLAPEPRTQAKREGRTAANAAAHNAPNAAHVTPIAPKFYLISDASANLLLLVGDDSSFVVGVQQPALVKQALATLRELKAPPVKFALVIDDEHAPTYGDGGWGHRGATTLAHELLWGKLRKLGTTPAQATDGLGASADIALPAMSFSQVVQLHITGEDTHVIHDRARLLGRGRRRALRTLRHRLPRAGVHERRVSAHRHGARRQVVRHDCHGRLLRDELCAGPRRD